MSIPVQSKKKIATIVTIAVVLAIAGWTNNINLTSVLNATVALGRTWYILLEFQEKQSSRSCKTPRNHHHFHHHNRFCPPCCRRKKLTLIAPLNNNECPGEQFPPLSLTSHQHNAQPRNGRPQQPWPNFGDKLGNTISPTGGRTVSYGSSTWQTGNSETFLLGLCSSFRPSHSVCCTRLSHWCKLLLTTAFIAPRSITLKTSVIHPMSSILSPPQKASPPAMQSCLLPPPWPSCSQATAAWPCPPPQLSCSLPAGTTTIAIIPATLTPPGLTTGKVTGQAIGCHQTATSTGPATTLSTLTPLGLIPGRATGPLGKAKEAAQASTISRRTMARSLKAVAAAAQAAKDRQFRAFQEELGLSLDNDGEASAPSTPQKVAAWRPVAQSPQLGCRLLFVLLLRLGPRLRSNISIMRNTE